MKTLVNLFCAILVVFSINDTDAAAHSVSSRTKTSAGSFSITISAGWNLLSLPANVTNGAAQALFPATSSPAYIYDQSYFTRDTLENGYGFWIKFSTPETISVAGDTVLDKAVAVHTGWNLIGSLSMPMPVNLLYSEPDSIISSPYYRYVAASGYQVADTIKPGAGYWIKVKQDGTLFLTAPGGAEGPISDSTRSVILDSIKAFANRLPHIDDNADNLALLSYLRSIPEFEASDTLLGGVWGRFTDGRMFLRANDLHIGDTISEYSSPMIPKPGEMEQVMSPTDNLPTSTTAWICNALGSLFESPASAAATKIISDLKQWHTTTGYTIASNGRATVGTLKSVSNVGVFFIDSHGGYAEDRNNNYVYSVWTSTEQDFLFDFIFRRDLDDGSLVYMTAAHDVNGSGGHTEETHYAITSKFVQKYMNFQKGGVVFIDACWSHYGSEFAAMCLAKGAGLYVGWTMPVLNTDAARAARHFFDRMLGTNKFFPESPPQRPFDADLVWNDLIQKGYDSSRTSYGLAKFQIDPVIPRANLLAPSILQSYPSFLPGESKFYIDGLFGQDPRPDVAVKVGGATLNIQEWDSTKLTLNQPIQGGDVQVIIRGRKSNVTQYTQWHAVFNYTLLGRGTLKKHIVFNVDFLADVHKFRINIANPPIYGPAPRHVQVLSTSSATYDCSGEYRDPTDTAITVEKWEGSGTVPLGPDFSFSTVIWDVGTPFGMGLSFSAPYINTNSSATLQIEYALDKFTTTMNSSYVLVAGSKPGGDETNTAEITWGDITPLYPPDPNGAR